MKTLGLAIVLLAATAGPVLAFQEYGSLVWLRRVRAKLAAEDARGPNSRAVRERERRVDALIAKLGLRRMSADAARARPRRPG